MKNYINTFTRRIRKTPISWRVIRQTGDSIFQAGWRLGVLLLLLGVVIFLAKGLRNDTYAIEAFQMPQAFNDAGLTGVVMAKKLVDELREVDQFISSVKEGPLSNIQSNVGQPDLNVEVMGIGLTLNTVTYYLKDIFGRENRSIAGELTDLDSTLNLTLRMSGAEPAYFSQSYRDQKRTEALNYLLHEAAKQIILNLDPYRIAVYHYRNKNREKSLEIINNMLVERPEESSWAYLAWGNLLNQEERREEALEKFNMALEHDPDFKLVLANMAWTEVNLERFDKALGLFKKLTKQYKKDGSYWNGLAICHRNLNQHKEAEKAYAGAVAADPENVYWYRNWASYRGLRGDTSGVEEILNTMQEKAPLRGVNYFLAMASYETFKGRNKEALKLVESALELDPDNMDALQQLAPAYFNLTQKYDSVKTLSRRIIRLADSVTVNNPRYIKQRFYNYLAMAEYSLNELDSALIHVNTAIALDTNISYPYTTLAETYDLMENQEGFYQAVEKALEKGFNLRPYLKQPPYNKYVGQERFQQLLEEYLPEENEAE